MQQCSCVLASHAQHQLEYSLDVLDCFTLTSLDISSILTRDRYLLTSPTSSSREILPPTRVPDEKLSESEGESTGESVGSVAW